MLNFTSLYVIKFLTNYILSDVKLVNFSPQYHDKQEN